MAQTRDDGLDHKHDNAAPAAIPPQAAAQPSAAPVADAKDETKSEEVKETPEQARTRMSASLAKSVARMFSQAQAAHLEQISRQVEEKKTAGAEGRPPKPITQPIYDPKMMYGYDSKEGAALKEWVGSMKLAEIESQRQQGIDKIQVQRMQEDKQIVGQREQALKTKIESIQTTATVAITVEEQKRAEAKMQLDEAEKNLASAEEKLAQLTLSVKTSEAALAAVTLTFQQAQQQKEKEEKAIQEREEKGEKGGEISWQLQVEVDKAEALQVEASNAVKGLLDEAKKADDGLNEAKQIRGKNAEHFVETESKVVPEIQKINQESKAEILKQTGENEASQTQEDKDFKVASQARLDDFNANMDTINNFEQNIKKLQNSWMTGRPVELAEAKSKVDELKRALENKDVKAVISQERQAELTTQLNEFTNVFDKQLGHLSKLAEGRAYTSSSAELGAHALTQRILYQKLDYQEKHQGRCDLLHQTNAPEEKDIEGLLNSGSNRAYVVVGAVGAESLYYINKETKECSLVCASDSNEMKALINEMKEGQKRGHLSLGWQKTAHPLTSRPLHEPEMNKHPGSSLTHMQEHRIREIAHHSRTPEQIQGQQPKLADWKEQGEIRGGLFSLYSKQADPATDWKAILPIVIVDEYSLLNEKQLRAKEEKVDMRTARDNALDRLSAAQKKQGMAEYDCSGERFKVTSKRDDKEKLTFHVAFGSHPFLKPNRADAMSRIVLMCHANDPLSPVELNCPEFNSHTSVYFINRIVSELEHCILAAEKSRLEGVPIGITFSDNALQALGQDLDKNLRQRAAVLQQAWEEHVKGKEQKKESAAQANIADTKLSIALASTTPERVVAGDDKFQHALAEAFHLKTNPEKMVMLDEEVKKLDSKILQFDVTTMSVDNQLRTLGEEIKKSIADRDEAKATTQYQELGRLEAAQHVANEGLAELSGVVGQGPRSKYSGLAGNYAQRMESTVMQGELKVDLLDPSMISAENYLNIKNDNDRNGRPTAPPEAELKDAISYMQPIMHAKEVGEKARAKYIANTHEGDNNLTKITALKESIRAFSPKAAAANVAPVAPAVAAPPQPAVAAAAPPLAGQPIIDPSAPPASAPDAGGGVQRLRR